MKKLLFIPLAILFLLSCEGAKTTGGIDTSFGTEGKVSTAIGTADDEAYCLTIQSDGKVLVGGRTYNGANYDFALARYETSGTMDTSFDTDGTQKTDFSNGDDGIYGIGLQSDGKIVTAGYSTSGSSTRFALARYNTDGSLDITFGSSGKVTTPFGSTQDEGRSLVIQADDKILVAGFTKGLSNYDFALARYSSSGSLDTDFDSDGKVTLTFASGDDQAHAIALQSNGKIVVGGYAKSSVNNVFAVARFNSNGSIDTGFGSNGKQTVYNSINANAYGYAVRVTDQKIILAGTSDSGSSTEIFLTQLNSSGLIDTSFNKTGKATGTFGTGQSSAKAFSIQGNGLLLAAGIFSGSGTPDFGLARFATDGTADASFGTQGKITTDFNSNIDEAYALGLSGSYIYLAGRTYNGSNYDLALTRYVQ